MGTVTGFIPGEDLIGEYTVVHTPVLDGTSIVEASIVVPPTLIDRVTTKALTEEIDEWDPEETPESALETWIGRFATGELWDAGHKVSGWAGNMGLKVEGLDAIDQTRQLPFLRYNDSVPTYEPINADSEPQHFAVEQRFTPRIIGFLLDKQIIE